MFVVHRECAGCAAVEERLFTDTYTGKDLCSLCLIKVLPQTTMSPESEGDNLPELLEELES